MAADDVVFGAATTSGPPGVFDIRPCGQLSGVFLFFSSRMGCLGSLVVSALLTLLLLVLFDVI